MSGRTESSRVDLSAVIENEGFDGLDDLLINPSAAATSSELDLRALTPFQRALLTIDGTVTTFLEAYTLERIEVIKLSQRVHRLAADHEWLQAPTGTDVLVRQVLLRGDKTSAVYAYALSLLVPERMPEGVRRDLDVHGGGLGRIMQDWRLETYREVLGSGYEQHRDLPEAFQLLSSRGLIGRTYRIFAGGAPIMLIHEKFPAQDPECSAGDS